MSISKQGRLWISLHFSQIRIIAVFNVCRVCYSNPPFIAESKKLQKKYTDISWDSKNWIWKPNVVCAVRRLLTVLENKHRVILICLCAFWFRLLCMCVCWRVRFGVGYCVCVCANVCVWVCVCMCGARARQFMCVRGRARVCLCALTDLGYGREIFCVEYWDHWCLNHQNLCKLTLQYVS